jgi:hypothetical protein
MRENAPALAVYDRCGDEWIHAGQEAIITALPSPSIESAMTITGILEPWERQKVYDKVKMISRAVVRESMIAREKARAKEP